MGRSSHGGDGPRAGLPGGPQVPGSVRQVLARCLAKDPERRYPNTRDLEVELRRIKEPTHSVTRRQLLWFGAGTAVAAATGVATWQLWPADPRIAVLPFTNPARDEDAESLSYGLTTTLIDRIHRLPITVMAYSLVSNFKKEADPRIAGRALRVQTVLTGTVRRQSGRLLITAELIDVATGASVWSQTYNRASEDLFAVQDEIATAIVADGATRSRDTCRDGR
jgi:TolB-like protein